MSVINTTTNLWIAVTKDGEALCHGNMNEHLSYHISSYRWDSFNDNIVSGTRRWEIMEHIKKWNKECVKVFRCKPVKVAITIKEIKKGEK